MTANLFIALAMLAVLWGIVSSMAIVSYLSSRGRKINYFLIRVMILKYISDYHDLTVRERGKPGPWYYSYITAMLLALVFAFIGLALR
jgi:hypothetical protein